MKRPTVVEAPRPGATLTFTWDELLTLQLALGAQEREAFAEVVRLQGMVALRAQGALRGQDELRMRHLERVGLASAAPPQAEVVRREVEALEHARDHHAEVQALLHRCHERDAP